MILLQKESKPIVGQPKAISKPHCLTVLHCLSIYSGLHLLSRKDQFMNMN